MWRRELKYIGTFHLYVIVGWTNPVVVHHHQNWSQIQTRMVSAAAASAVEVPIPLAASSHCSQCCWRCQMLMLRPLPMLLLVKKIVIGSEEISNPLDDFVSLYGWWKHSCSPDGEVGGGGADDWNCWRSGFLCCVVLDSYLPCWFDLTFSFRCCEENSMVPWSYRLNWYKKWREEQ